MEEKLNKIVIDKEITTITDNAPKDKGITIAIPEKKNERTQMRDLVKVKKEIIEILEYMNTDQMIELEAKNRNIYEMHIESKFEDFATNYYTILKLLFDKEGKEENLIRLLELFDRLGDIKKRGSNLDKEYERFIEEQREAYLYPQFGGKRNFEKEMLKGKKDKK